MKSSTRMLIIIPATMFLGAGCAILASRFAPHVGHAPISRPPVAAVDEKVIERAKAWTVLISNEGFEPKYRGTGMLVDATHVLTANHMVSRNDNEMWVYIFPGRRVVHAKAVSENASDDLALLELDEKVELPAYATFQEAHHDGEPILVIGNILGGMRWYVSYGIVSSDWAGYILMDGTMTHGDSGGPWINARGEVVGMSDWQLGDEEPESAIKGGVSAKKIRSFLGVTKKPLPPISETYTVEHSEPIR